MQLFYVIISENVNVICVYVNFMFHLCILFRNVNDLYGWQANEGDGRDQKAPATNNNNNNNPICKAPECQKTSVALADRNSRAN